MPGKEHGTQAGKEDGMQITSSYGVEIRKVGSPVSLTYRVYRDAVRVLALFYDTVWEELSVITDKKRRFNHAEHLVHGTKKNLAVHDFDSRFPKMPSYLRRSAITHALGAVSSYRTRLAQWEEGGKEGKAPALGERTHAMPVFYRKNMYREEDGDAASLKLYNGRDWVWVKVALLHTDMEYLRKNWTGVKASAPILEKKHGKYYLRFSYREERALPAKGAHEQRICAVDLGLNSDAVCSIMEADGTVCARKFIDFADEKDRLWKVLGRIRRKSREHGPESVRGLWKYAVRCNEELAKKTAAAIARFAEENGADVIVFEYLDMKGKIRGKRKMRLHMWKKRGIQKICTHMAHRKGIRVSRVCAWNTSALAYDGSGDVMRDPDNHSLCTFTSGKRYNCDLSASYNIGARYYIRELTKPMLATAWSVLEAEVPAVRRRSSCVYVDLVRLHAVMRENGWTA